MMTNAKPLKDLCISIVDCPHSTPQWTDAGKLVIRNSYIKNGTMYLSSPSYTDAESFESRCKRIRPTSGDIIITREAPMGEVCMIPDGLECCLGQRMVLLRPNTDKCDGKYLLYILQSQYVQHQISWSNGTGTTVSNLRIPHLENLEIPYIPLSEQRAIAATLFCLDDKIELNNRINKTLEQMAQAIFKSWFVDFEPWGGVMPEDWREGVFSDITKATLAGDWGKDSPTGNNTQEAYCIRGADIPEVNAGNKGKMPVRYILPKNYESKQLTVGDIVLEISGGSPTQSTGRCALITQSLLDRYDRGMVCTNFCKAIKPQNGYSYFVYFYLRYLYAQSVMFSYENGTTGIKNFDLSGFLQTEPIVIPTFETVTKFAYAVCVFIDKTFGNGLESESLATLRDTLLPRLMSGELSVSDLDA